MNRAADLELVLECLAVLVRLLRDAHKRHHLPAAVPLLLMLLLTVVAIAVVVLLPPVLPTTAIVVTGPLLRQAHFCVCDPSQHRLHLFERQPA